MKTAQGSPRGKAAKERKIRAAKPKRQYRPDPAPRMRICQRCGETKPATHFEKWRRWCTACLDSAKPRGHGGHRERSGKHCPCCFGLPWRRPVGGVCQCGEPYGEEVIEHA